MPLKYSFMLAATMICGIAFMGIGLATVDAGSHGETVVDGYAVQLTSSINR